MGVDKWLLSITWGGLGAEGSKSDCTIFEQPLASNYKDRIVNCCEKFLTVPKSIMKFSPTHCKVQCLHCFQLVSHTMCRNTQSTDKARIFQ